MNMILVCDLNAVSTLTMTLIRISFASIDMSSIVFVYACACADSVSHLQTRYYFCSWDLVGPKVRKHVCAVCSSISVGDSQIQSLGLQ